MDDFMTALFSGVQKGLSVSSFLSPIVGFGCNHPIPVLATAHIAIRILTKILDPNGSRIKRSFFKRFFTIVVPDNFVYSLFGILHRVPDLRALKDPTTFLVALSLTAMGCQIFDVGRLLMAKGLDALAPSASREITCLVGFHPFGPRDYYAQPRGCY